MSISTLDGHVMASLDVWARVFYDRAAASWVAQAQFGYRGIETIRGVRVPCSTWESAMWHALRARRRLEDEAMDEVHASRAARRAATDTAALITTGEPA